MVVMPEEYKLRVGGMSVRQLRSQLQWGTGAPGHWNIGALGHSVIQSEVARMRLRLVVAKTHCQHERDRETEGR